MPKRLRLGSILFNTLVGLIYVFLLAAPLVVVYYSFSPGVVLRLPPEGFTFRWYGNFLAQPRLIEGVLTSTWIALLSTVLALLAGVPAAYALTRLDVPGRRALAALFLSPLNLPGLVLAIGLLMFVVSALQPLLNMSLVGRLPPLLAAHVIVTVPWVIRTVSTSLETADRAPEEAARSLGATPLTTFLLVTVPAIQPGVVAGAIFAFIVSFGNFALSLFFTGPGIITLPVAIFQYIDQFQDPTVAAGSTIVILLTTVVVILADRLGSLSRGLGARADRPPGATPASSSSESVSPPSRKESVA
jgi:putative spermidine/putrescine transport system permease protein